MQKVEQDSFNVIGISVRTTNENGQAAEDIATLWSRFMSEDIRSQIPQRLDDTIYSIYTDYEGDHTRPYTALLACRVENLDEIPEGMIGKRIEGGTFSKTTAKGDLREGVIVNEWTRIWNMGLDRKYTSDFEMYGEKAQDPTDAEVDFFVAIER